MTKFNFILLMMILSSCSSNSKKEIDIASIKNILISNNWNLFNHNYNDSILVLNRKKYNGCNQRIKFENNGEILISDLNREQFSYFSKNSCEIISYGNWSINESDQTLNIFFKGDTFLLSQHYYQRLYSIESISDEKIKLKQINSLLEHHLDNNETNN